MLTPSSRSSMYVPHAFHVLVLTVPEKEGWSMDTQQTHYGYIWKAQKNEFRHMGKLKNKWIYPLGLVLAIG